MSVSENLLSQGAIPVAVTLHVFAVVVFWNRHG